jgi:hypothetical protein
VLSCPYSTLNTDIAAVVLLHLFQPLQASGSKLDTAIETQLCYELKTFLLAGHETSAAMLMWSVFELSRAPAARQQVRGGEARRGTAAGVGLAATATPGNGYGS